MYHPSLTTAEREPCLKRVSGLGYDWSDGLGFRSAILDTCFPRTYKRKCKTPEEYSTLLEGRAEESELQL